MGFWSSLGSSAMSMASGLSLHDATGGWSDFSSRQSSAKYESQLSRRLMDYQYALDQRSLRESPSAYKAGLIAAGYNPMLALTNGITTPSVGLGSGGHMPASDGSSKPFDGLARRVKDTADAELENLNAQADSIRSHTAFDGANSAADVALKTAEADKVRKEADSIDPATRRRHDRYGTSSYGRMLEDITLKLSDFLDINSALRAKKAKRVSSSRSDFSDNSAKSIKVISDDLNREEKLRGDTVRKRRIHH